MDEKKFIKALEENNIDSSNVCFNDSVKDDIFCVMENYYMIEVFYRERGRRSKEKKFGNESEALQYLLECLQHIKYM